MRLDSRSAHGEIMSSIKTADMHKLSRFAEFVYSHSRVFSVSVLVMWLVILWSMMKLSDEPDSLMHASLFWALLIIWPLTVGSILVSILYISASDKKQRTGKSSSK
jgi:hypothetical protein